MIERIELSIPIFSHQKKTQKIVKLFQALWYRDLVQLATSGPYGWSFPQDASLSRPFPLFLLPSVSTFPSSFPFPLFFLPPSDMSSLFSFLLFHYHPWYLVIICKQKEGREVFHFRAVAQRECMTLFPVVLCFAWETLCTIMQLNENITYRKTETTTQKLQKP